jgi:hypothetical protein
MQIWLFYIILVVKIMSINSSLQKTYALTYKSAKNKDSTIILKENLADCENLPYKVGKMSAAVLHEAIFKAFDDRERLEKEIERLNISLADHGMIFFCLVCILFDSLNLFD